MQSQLNAALLRCDRLAETAAARVEALGVRLANAAAGALAPYDQTSLGLKHLEDDMQVGVTHTHTRARTHACIESESHAHASYEGD